jgi:putative transcriptional regulator
MHLYRPKTKTSEVDQIKSGSVLIAQKLWDNELFSRAVILILEHDATGTTGIILNKSNLLSQSLSILMNTDLQYGGAYDTHRVGFIHQIKDLSKAIKISDDVYYSENFNELETIISDDIFNVAKIKAFIGFTVWKAGELEQEITDKKWWITDFKLDELYQVNGNELWGYKLLKSGNIYGLFYDMPDPSLN